MPRLTLTHEDLVEIMTQAIDGIEAAIRARVPEATEEEKGEYLMRVVLGMVIACQAALTA